MGVLLEPAWEASCLLGSWESFGPSRVSGVSCLLLCLEIIWRRLGAIWGSGAIWKPSWAVLKLLGPMSPCPMSTPSDAIRQNFWSNLLPPAAAGRRRPIRIEWTSPGGGEMGGGNHLTRRVPPRGRRNTLAPLRPCDPQEGGVASKFEQSVVAHSVRGSRFGHRDHMKSKATVLVLAAWGLGDAELKS